MGDSNMGFCDVCNELGNDKQKGVSREMLI